MYRNLRIVPQLVYGRGSIRQLGDVLAEKRSGAGMVFLIDEVHRNKPFIGGLPLGKDDAIIYADVSTEPKTAYVDSLVATAREEIDDVPDGVVGIGGGSTMDLAKAVSVMLTNPGSAADYQGWDLVKNPSVYHVGVPTLAGTGAEVSRTAVLTGPERKLGINSDYTPFDQIILDPDLLAGVPANQRFYTAMDCFIHASESLHGSFINEFARAYAEKSQELCRAVFLGDLCDKEADEKLTIASYFGGLSIAYSQVGVCHALSYGLSFTLGVRHGVGNCIVFDQLDEYYPHDVSDFRRMMEKHAIDLPRNVCAGLDDEAMEKTIDVALGMKPLWENALGPDWASIMTRDKARELYLRM